MKIKFGLLLAGVLTLMLSTAVFAADIHLEGEKYSKIE